jgi:O-antigen biosynthesis protein
VPLASIILPAYYSDDTIADCLKALKQQTFRDFEVIVVNSSPETRTAAAVAAFPETKLIQSPTRLLPHAARNRGVEEASGHLLVFSDPDCSAHSDWLATLVECWRSGHEAVGGAMGLASKGWMEGAIHLTKFHWCLTGHNGGTRWILPTANAAYSRRVWDRIGPFPDVFAGDAVQSWKAGKLGIQPWFEPRAIVSHTHGQTLRALMRQRVARGREFGRVRAEFEHWSKLRLLANLLFAPFVWVLVLLRAGRDAAVSGWLTTYLATLPVQAAAHAAWSFGEAAASWRALMKSEPQA